MLPILHYFEICLRNRIDQLFKKNYASDWLINVPSELMLSQEDLRKIEKVILRLRRETNKEPTHDGIVPNMTFGFWRSFFNKKYDTVIWHRKNSITSVFPNLQHNHRRRFYIEHKLLNIKELRNRIAHHEPIWNQRNLVYLGYDACKELIHAISAEALVMLKAIDRFSLIEKNLFFE